MCQMVSKRSLPHPRPRRKKKKSIFDHAPLSVTRPATAFQTLLRLEWVLTPIRSAKRAMMPSPTASWAKYPALVHPTQKRRFSFSQWSLTLLGKSRHLNAVYTYCQSPDPSGTLSIWRSQRFMRPYLTTNRLYKNSCPGSMSLLSMKFYQAMIERDQKERKEIPVGASDSKDILGGGDDKCYRRDGEEKKGRTRDRLTERRRKVTA